jgi:hypothetical protein
MNNMNNIINETIIIFDDKLKQFIKKIKKDIDLNVLMLDNKYDNLKEVFDKQEEIRNYIKTNENQFNTVNGKKLPYYCNRENYAIMILLLVDDLDNEKYISFEDITRELFLNSYLLMEKNKEFGFNQDIKNYYTEKYSNFGLDENDFKCKCFCGHECMLKHIFIFCNKKENMFLLVGCDCYYKIEIKELDYVKPEITNIIKKRKINHFKKLYDVNDFKYITKTDDNEYDDDGCFCCKTKQKQRKYYIFIYNNNNKVKDICFCDNCSLSLNLISKYGFCKLCKKGKISNKKDKFCDYCNNKTNCKNCKKREICDENGYCNNCFNNLFLKRNCLICGKIDILDKKDYWKTKCLKCYLKQI